MDEVIKLSRSTVEKYLNCPRCCVLDKKYKKHIWKARRKHLSSLGKYGPRDTFIPWSNSGINRYYYAFKTKGLRKLLEENGFKVILEHTARNILFICKKS